MARNSEQDVVRLAADLERAHGEFNPKDIAARLGGDDFVVAQAAKRGYFRRVRVDSARDSGFYVLSPEGRAALERDQ